MRPWRVLVEEQLSRKRDFRIETHLASRQFETRQDAREAAAKLAWNHRPRHPAFPQERAVLREDPDRFVVRVLGKSGGTYVFKLTVCEVLESAAAAG